MRPKIALTSSYIEEKAVLNEGYYLAVEKAGGIPFITPPLEEVTLQEILEFVDGVLITGGPDVDPLLFGEDPVKELGEVSPARDKAEIFLVKEAFNRGLPVMGICRGIQVINVALGGSLYQDLPSQLKGSIKHSQSAPRWYATHTVKVQKGTILFEIFNSEEVKVNSFHHQAIKNISPNLKAVAYAPDGVVEAVEAVSQDKFILGLQWHPEGMWQKDPVQLKPFERFIEEIKRRKGR
ncbi:gamma-glutamyl-gamma-aminobutyrate hydrolase family protein [Thermovenabulum gondwanense]|uniref:Putative glutamine amidotransferase n=1 Tax=Thermovenabulum gondwanense TaxID=520767 RepID=A0A162MP24_9FIRM|nr:gamma-glutamyl-gamma-aminobutyrate hydrolase family protein [Thermovenabulum gondwanense]KYO66837.1 putative glutamine amidotransferase [Thermovenabulum gondwanense]